MKFEIYCDESHPDVFWSHNPGRASYCLIGSLWLPAEQRKVIKNEIIGLKEMYGFTSEIKWHKSHERYESFFNSLVDLYLDYNRQDQLRFRCITIESDKIYLVKFHESDAELGFYKFYYQLLVHWILDFNEYRIFCDDKTNRIGNRLGILRYFLDCSNITSCVVSVQALPSTEVLLLQFTDFLLGMASSRMNNAISEDSTKNRIIRHLEDGLGINRLSPTSKGDRRFNIFKINLSGGW